MLHIQTIIINQKKKKKEMQKKKVEMSIAEGKGSFQLLCWTVDHGLRLELRSPGRLGQKSSWTWKWP
jgi:hypothetical protein